MVVGESGKLCFIANGDSEFSGDFKANKGIFAANVSIGTLNVTKHAIFAGPVSMLDVLEVEGDILAMDVNTTNLLIDQTLEVHNMTYARGGLVVKGGKTQLNGDLFVTGLVTSDGLLETKNLTVSESLTVLSAATMQGTMTVNGDTYLATLYAMADAVITGDVISLGLYAETICIQGSCRSAWPNSKSVMEEKSKDVVSEAYLDVGDVEEMFFIGNFENSKMFSLQVTSLEGTGVFQTEVLKGASDGTNIEYFEGERISRGAFWGSVRRRDNFGGICKIKVSVIEVF